MKLLNVIIPVLFPFFAYTQSYIGGQVQKNIYSFTLHQEIELDSSFVIGGFKTVISDNSGNSELKLRAGVKIGSPELQVIIYMPIFNLSLKEGKYNTPFNAEVRYTCNQFLKGFKLNLGIEIYKNTSCPYFNLMVPFVTNKRINSNL